MKKDYCLLCNEYVDSIIIDKTKKYEEDLISMEYEGKVAKCPICGEEIYNDDVIKYNQEQIDKQYIIENEIITKATNSLENDNECEEMPCGDVKPEDVPYEKYKALERENEVLKDVIVRLTVKTFALEKQIHPDVW